MTSVEVAVLPTDPLAVSEPGAGEVILVADERELLATLRSSIVAIRWDVPQVMSADRRRLIFNEEAITAAKVAARNLVPPSFVVDGRTFVEAHYFLSIPTSCEEALHVARDAARALAARGKNRFQAACVDAFAGAWPQRV